LSSMANPRHQLLANLKALVVEVQSIMPEPKSPLDGNEIMEILKIRPSKLVGEIKEYLCEQVIDGVVLPDDKEALKVLAKEFYESRRGENNV